MDSDNENFDNFIKKSKNFEVIRNNDDVSENDEEYGEYDEEGEYEDEYDPDYYILEKEIEDLIHTTISSLEKIVLNNKTILFLEEENCKLPNLFESMDFLTTFGKLLIFKDTYFSRACLSGITR